MSFVGTMGFLLLPAVILLLSAVSAMIFKMPKDVESALQHFAGGVVLSAVAIELVPIILAKEASIPSVSAGFLLGVATLLFVRQTFGHGHGGGDGDHGHGGHGHGHSHEAGGRNEDHGHENEKGHSGHGEYERMEDGPSAAVNWSSILPVLIDFMCDGLLMGLSFAAGEGAGLILVLSIALEMSSVGAAVFQGMRSSKVPTGKAFSVMIFLAAALFGSGAGAFMVSGALAGTPLFFGLMSYGVAACLWLAGEDLLVEGHSDGEKSWVTSMFFLGFLLPVLLEKMERAN